MGSDSTQSVMELPLRLFGWAFLRPGKLSQRVKIWHVFLVSTSLAHVVLTFTQFFGAHHDINKLTRNLESQASSAQIFIKLIVTLYYRNEIMEFAKLWDKFLNLDEHLSPQRAAALRKFLKWIKRCQMGYVIGGFSFIAASMLAMVLGKLTLLTGTWVWQDYKCLYYVEFGIQLCVVPLLSFIILGLDIFFLGICSQLGVQCRVLKYYVENLLDTEKQTTGVSDRKMLQSKIKLLVDHHNFLLHVFKRVGRVFSFTLLVQYILSALLMCAELYILAENYNASLGSSGRSIIIYFLLLMQLAGYLMPAEYTASETEILSYAIYNSRWHEMERFSYLKSPLLLVAQRSQTREEFTMGYLANANVVALLKAIKLSFSIFMLLRNLKER